MGVLDKLKIVALAPKVKRSVEQDRRAKLVEQLTEQLKLVEAALGGAAYQRTKDAWISTSLGEGNDYATGLAIQGDGKLVVAGYHQEGDSTNIAVARYEANGDLDQAFGTADDGTENGIVNISLGDGDDIANAVAVQGDKLIVVAGTTTATDGSKNIAVLRLTAQ